MKFDFTTVPERKGKDAIAVDIPVLNGFDINETVKPGFDLIPMWVADMNFVVPACITDTVSERLEHPSFGYYLIRDEYYDSIQRWHEERHGISDITKETIGYENGLLGGLVSSLKVLLPEGGKVLLHSPTYIGFTHVLKDNGYKIVSSELVKDQDGTWRMDLSDMEKKIKDGKIKVAVFCSPHNPTGRVWSREELEQAAELFERYGVTVISDEIWSDLILFGNRHIPFASVSKYAHNNTVELYAPSKTFNLAGLIGSYHVIYNPKLRNKIETYEKATSYNSMNVLSMYALIGAYSEEGSEWVDDLIHVLEENVDLALNSLKKVPGIAVERPQGTYMLFLDCKEFCEKNELTLDELLKKGMEVGVLWQDGRPFGGTHTIRMNLASPTHRIEEALKRLERHVWGLPESIWEPLTSMWEALNPWNMFMKKDENSDKD
ncbi:MAG: aminotransferase class I/II-fold pyridoxal phosphate-dependent enzyme [Lachnospiraceae bacterium]|nr:aminotransferase class I/II-fold pyridoxal phosphate-dependent enzyme [Lachnospiraceae bacterium]